MSVKKLRGKLAMDKGLRRERNHPARADGRPLPRTGEDQMPVGEPPSMIVLQDGKRIPESHATATSVELRCRCGLLIEPGVSMAHVCPMGPDPLPLMARLALTAGPDFAWPSADLA